MTDNKLHFDVAYYDQVHETELQRRNHVATTLSKFVREGFKCREDDFWTYALFREQKDILGWQTYEEMRRRLPTRIRHFRDYVSTSGGRLVSVFGDADHRDPAVVEAVGVGTSLALLSELYGLSEADWSKIPATTVKDLDFEIATDGDRFVEVEAKGTVTTAVRRVSPTVSQHKSSITEKKCEQRSIRNNKNELWGVTTAIPTSDAEDPLCRLLDPPAIDPHEDPAMYRVLARLRFFDVVLRPISRSHLLIALANRIPAILLASDFRDWGGRPLLTYGGGELKPPQNPPANKTVVGDDLAFGEVVPIESGHLYFYGIDFAIMEILCWQDFREITSFKSNLPNRLSKPVRVHLRLREADLEFLGHLDQMPKLDKSINRYRQEAWAELSANSSGRVFGDVWLDT